MLRMIRVVANLIVWLVGMALITLSVAQAQQTSSQVQTPYVQIPPPSGHMAGPQEFDTNPQGFISGSGFTRGPVAPVRPVIPPPEPSYPYPGQYMAQQEPSPAEEKAESSRLSGEESNPASLTPDSMAVAGTEAIFYPNPRGGAPIEPGVGMSRQPPLPQVLNNLNWTLGALEDLETRLRTAADSGIESVVGTPLQQYADKVLNDARLALQSMEHSSAAPDWSQDVQEAYQRVVNAKRLLLFSPTLAAGTIKELRDYVIDLRQETQQALASPDPVDTALERAGARTME